ncbi:hypothetical protein IPH92_03480 [Candidatus Kaiserbacteria bacterium]|nr:MAG: hypothetical protein IPH92_03480 [Candidatus Kaiserbacteria bacterium]
MSFKNTTLVVGVLALGALIILVLLFVYTTKIKSSELVNQNTPISAPISSSTPPAVAEEEKHEEVIEVLQNQKEFFVIGEVTSVENTTLHVKLSPESGYPTERSILVSTDAKTLLLLISNKEPVTYEKEIKEFVNNGNQGKQPKTYIEKEIAINEIQVGDRITAVSFDEVSTSTNSFLAKTISIQKNLPAIPKDLPVNLTEIPENTTKMPEILPSPVEE